MSGWKEGENNKLIYDFIDEGHGLCRAGEGLLSEE